MVRWNEPLEMKKVRLIFSPITSARKKKKTLAEYLQLFHILFMKILCPLQRVDLKVNVWYLRVERFLSL